MVGITKGSTFRKRYRPTPGSSIGEDPVPLPALQNVTGDSFPGRNDLLFGCSGQRAQVPIVYEICFQKIKRIRRIERW